MPSQSASSTISSDTAASGGASAATAGVIVPPEARQKYPDLVELILRSESMNTEERNYWLQVLPVMTKEQIAELRDILETEKKKLAAIDAKYNAPKADEGTPVDPVEAERRRREAREQRQRQEKEQQKAEEAAEQQLLGRLQDL